MTGTGTAADDRVFAALANSVRREVLRLLRDGGPQPVQALAAHFDMARPSLSEHLKVLRDAGLVSEQRSGRQRIYRLEAAPLAEVQDWLHPYERFWRDRLKGLGELLDRMPDDDAT
ncbi:ArsR/SmtB family transcription factor [Streptomyces aquilus]|uniref:ArsR/SmtB family transcription factor n=1 Tax=Streptomyces aquilus TaxID=2548456 RepID=UPI0036D0605F